MEFTPFTVVNTNIFPVANSHAGGQLATEYNLKSRESVATDSNVTYVIGPSYTHGLGDFYVTASGMTLTVAAGRAVVNGHFIESLSEVTIDLSEAVADIKDNFQDYRPTAGLSIGLKANYSTEETLSGSMLAEDLDGIYQGISVVVLPTFNDSAYNNRSVNTFNTPSDVPQNPEYVTAHLLLATFSFVNGTVRNLPEGNNDDKIRAFSADRISNIDSSLSSDYVRKDNLVNTMLYTFSGNSGDWCYSNDSLMVWDANPTLEPIPSDPQPTEARFNTYGNNVYLEVPHKQLDGDVYDDQHRLAYYPPKRYGLPKANFSLGTPGIVDAEYSATLRNLSDRLNELQTLGDGTYLKYIPILSNKEYNPNNAETTLPPILTTWDVGSYIVVGQDATVRDTNTEDGVYPSTMYMVVGVVTVLNSTAVTQQPETGVNLGTAYPSTDYPTHPTTADTIKALFINGVTKYGSVGDYFTFIEEDNRSYYYTVTDVQKQYSDTIYLTGQIDLATEETIGGFKNVPTTQTDVGYVYRDEYGYLRLLDYDLLRSGTLAYQLGANYTIPNGLDSETIQGYLDEYVNERVAFPNAQQLAYAAATGSPIDVIDVTLYLPQADDTTIINIYDLDSRFSTCTYFHILGNADSKTTVNFVNCQRIRIDQNISGSPIINLQNVDLYYDAVTLNYIMNCPRSESTYQTMGTDYTGIKDLKLWYKQYSDDDPEIYVDGMTVISPDIAADVASADYWSSNTTNDYHYVYALKSVTFDDTCKMIGCEMLIKNNTTATAVQTGTQILSGEYSLPQSTRLVYPEASIQNNLKIDGYFVTAYKPSGQNFYTVMKTSFTAMSGTATYTVVNTKPNNWDTVYVNYYSKHTVDDVDIYISLVTDSSAPTWAPNTYYAQTSATGNIAILVEVEEVTDANISPDINNVPGWSVNSYHTFIGGVSQS